ncbi:hypothetical protein BJ875DRAFT_53768 [Amylocarpus encephaloides]|uniref:Uncharacterized protein n=1 Tax=Amylocarpus encephaloides TaxID=45428 RepID=A0A9P8C4I9_9HELO|nr:hypothetical protein BJ875DRAFT_53768 [Amylocarpus encephaloides]
MSFGFSPADILTGIQACRWLWNNCFDKNNAADERYKQFGNDVRLLETRLDQLKGAFQNALDRYEQPNLDARDLRGDLRDVIGDFQHTIDQCVEILNKHVNLKRNQAGFIENVIWAASSQEKVDALGRRIQFHTQKIYLVMEPVTLGLLTTIDGKVDEILDLMRTHFAIEDPLPNLPAWLDSWLQQTIFENPPEGLVDLNHIPLKEGFDALYSHFRESTYAFRDPETADQTVEQYLNLLKSQWLLEMIRNGEPFRRARPGSLYPRTMAQLEKRIKDQHRRKDIIRFHDSELQKLNRTAWLIWLPAEVVQNKFMTDPNVGEEEILKLSVPNYLGVVGKDNLVVFRTGPTTLRIVRSVIGDRSGTPYYESERFNIHIDKFIPFYAIQESTLGAGQRRGSGAMSSVGIYRGNETGETAYQIQEDKDLFNFQRAVTGYQIVFDNNLAWALYHSPKISKSRGKIQIWHWKPLTHDSLVRRDSITSSSSGDSKMSQMTSTSKTVEQVLKGQARSRVSVHDSSENSSTIGASTPPLPIIMVYAQSGGEYSYYYIELGFGMQIVPTACDCNKNSKICRRIVIERRKIKGSEMPFVVRKMSVLKQDLSAWNLSIFAHPRHPNFDNRKFVQPVDCKFLNLDFDTVADREDFGRKFKKALDLRDAAEKEFRSVVNRTTFLSEKASEAKDLKPRRGSTLSKFTRPSSGSSFWSSTSNISDTSTEKTMRTNSINRKPVVQEAPVELHGNSLPRLRPISTFSSININDVTSRFFN